MKPRFCLLALFAALVLQSASAAEPETRPRAREVGVVIGTLPTGPRNAITDVEGVGVGQATLAQGTRFQIGRAHV